MISIWVGLVELLHSQVVEQIQPLDIRNHDLVPRGPLLESGSRLWAVAAALKESVEVVGRVPIVISDALAPELKQLAGHLKRVNSSRSMVSHVPSSHVGFATCSSDPRQVLGI